MKYSFGLKNISFCIIFFIKRLRMKGIQNLIGQYKVKKINI